MNCPDCSNPVEKDAKFCPKCYARIEPPGLLQRVIAFFQDLTRPGTHVITTKTTARLTTVDKDGNRRVFRTLAEAPPEMRAELEELQAEVEKEQGNLLSAEQLAPATGKHAIISKRTVSIYRIKDASGQERIYHSLDELPPETRAAVEAALKKMD